MLRPAERAPVPEASPTYLTVTPSGETWTFLHPIHLSINPCVLESIENEWHTVTFV